MLGASGLWLFGAVEFVADGEDLIGVREICMLRNDDDIWMLAIFVRCWCLALLLAEDEEDSNGDANDNDDGIMGECTTGIVTVTVGTPSTSLSSSSSGTILFAFRIDGNSNGMGGGSGWATVVVDVLVGAEVVVLVIFIVDIVESICIWVIWGTSVSGWVFMAAEFCSINVKCIYVHIYVNEKRGKL